MLSLPSTPDLVCLKADVVVAGGLVESNRFAELRFCETKHASKYLRNEDNA